MGQSQSGGHGPGGGKKDDKDKKKEYEPPVPTRVGLLAKAVANQTLATFLGVVGSELIQEYLGDEPKLVQELFRVAEEHAPSIMFIDKIKAIGTKRYDSNSGGHIDRKIKFPLPDEKTKKCIFQIHTSRMTLAKAVTLDDLIMTKDDLSGADVKAICTEAGLMALRERKMKITNEDVKKSEENVLYKK
ncbi:26S protease regulatory subunit 4 [Heterocephalus glaber]|uniref:26S protease regulatory subunit 4 n=1 Tax=Heterocephalus glaber TaxID=10181 RepID=G5BJN6_HETGA|nr:26S protease regulatory subunit 4 [Heterocephalus glaber]